MVFQYNELSFQILNVGKFPHKKGLFHIKARPYAALSFRLCGEGHFEIAGKQFLAVAGSVVFIPAHTPYKVEYSGGESIVFHLLDCNYAVPECHTMFDTRKVEALFAHALFEWEETYSVNRTKANVYSVLAQLDAETSLPTDETVLQCMHYIEQHYTEPTLSVEQLCAVCHVSRSALQRKYKQAMGVAPKEYITKRRLTLALSLLMQKKGSVKEIAHMTGFSDEKYFSRIFRATFGYPPSQVYHL